MIRKFFLFFLLCSLPLWAVTLPDALLQRFEIPSHLSSSELVQITQTLWCQKGKERWEFEAKFEEMREELAPLFQEMGYLKAILPRQMNYDYVLVHGATLKSVQSRVLYLQKLIDQGLQVKQIVFLTGMRRLLEAEKVGPHLEWESQMVEWVYDHSTLPRNTPVSFINAPERSVYTKVVRPTTSDTLFEWLKKTPTPGSCLAISNQPFVPYQDAVARNILPPQFSLETVGEETTQWSVAVVLDSVAKTLYEQERKKL